VKRTHEHALLRELAELPEIGQTTIYHCRCDSWPETRARIHFANEAAAKSAYRLHLVEILKEV